MTPQSNFMVMAPLDPNRANDLRKLLASMNRGPGVVNPDNDVVPFGRFDRLHFARFVILDDQTQDDFTRAYGLPHPNFPVYLAFLGDCDGPADDFLTDLARGAEDGLRRIFSCCQGFAPDADLGRWMKDHQQRPATEYVNWLGRTLKQIREEDALHNALEAFLDANAATLAKEGPRQIRDALCAYANEQRHAGRLSLTKPEPTPLDWQLRNLLNLLGVPIALLLILPLLVLYLPIFALQLRRRELQDLEIAPRPDPGHVKELSDLEDYSVTNQFTAFGIVKPGRFRKWTLSFILWAVSYTTQHIYNRGHLTRVGTIHFARWVFIDQKQRLMFASNYDGSLDSYMDDFINKVGWGLNLVFSNGIGYPRTNWLILDGAKDEQKFKYYIRRHELPSEVWYDAHPGLTTFDLNRNTMIREGLEKQSMSDAEILNWLRLF